MSEVTILKHKNGTPTKIEYQGRTYTLIHEDTYKEKRQ